MILRVYKFLHKGFTLHYITYDQRNHYITFPTTIAEMTECIATFERTRSELPNVAGAIDGTQFPIIALRETILVVTSSMT